MKIISNTVYNILLVLFFCMTVSVSYAQLPMPAGNVAAGKAKSATCAACHGQDGNGLAQNPVWPKLAGQHAKYTYHQLNAFKQGKEVGGRYNANMTPLMAGLSKQDMADLSAYYASLSSTVGYADKALLAVGQQIYRGGNRKTGVSACIACHGPRGLGNRAAAFPRLSGQFARYTQKQLHDYKNGDRLNGPAAIMQTVAKRMSEDEITAVSSYIEGLH